MKVKIKKWDIIIICILFVISFVPYIFIKVFIAKNTDNVYAYITVDNKFYKQIPLTGQTDKKEFVIHTSNGYNKLIVKNESICVEDADCKDHICEEFGWKNTPGDVIVCIPHGVCIEIKGTKSTDDSKEKMDTRCY